MKWFKRNFTLSITIFLILITTFAYALTSVEIKSHPDSTNSAIVANDKLNTAAEPYEDDISRGLISGKEDFNKFGKNGDVGTATEDVWSFGGTKTYLSSGEILKITSTDVDDDGDPADTGARTIEIYGLDDNYDEISETRTLNGQTAVDTVETYLRVYRAIIRSAGSTQSNEGTISIKNNASTVTMATIDPGEGQTLMTHYTVPNGKQMLIKNLCLQATGNKDVSIALYVRPFGEAWQVKLTATLNNGTFNRLFLPPFKIDAKSDVVIRAISVQAGGIVNAGWDSILEDL
jgi:hypothetical protein